MSGRRTFPQPTSGGRPEDRLDSWKEIAAYLGREPRTVRRWEVTENLPVHRLHHGKADSVYGMKDELDAWMARRSASSAAPALARWRRLRFLSGTAVIAIAVLFVSGGFLVLSRLAAPGSAPAPLPLTSDPGSELEAALSPDASHVAYVWDGESENNFDIYVRLVSGGPPLRLTTHPAQDYSPAWSPDGASIAFLRRTAPATAAVFVITALGGAERRVAEFPASEWTPWSRPGPFLAWSRDGSWLVTAGVPAPQGGDALLRISPFTGEMVPLTTAPARTMGDMAPAFSPDGRTLAFSRMLSWGRSQLCLLPVAEPLHAAGPVRVISTGSSWNASPVWTPDGRYLIFSTGSMDAPRLARLSVAGTAPPERLPAVGEYGWSPSIAHEPRGADRLVYTQHFESVNIWRASLDGAAPVQLITSAHWSYEPDWSPDGRRIAFLSDRTGFGEIWVADADGHNAQQWTFMKHARLGAPRWSPDGRRIAFTAPGARGSSIYLTDGPAAEPRAVPGSEECGYLCWSPDGGAFYFSSNRGGVQIWRIPAGGGSAVQITSAGGRVPAVSFDGRYLYYLKLAGADGRNDLWRLPLAGGPEQKVLEFVDAYSLADAAIAYKYYAPGPKPIGPRLQIFHLPGGPVIRLPDPSKALRYGVSLSRDGRRLLYAQADYQVGDLMLVENFR